MAKRILCLKLVVSLIVLSSSLGFSTQSWAQGAPASYSGTPGPKKQLATIIFAGLGGAVMGLSTLSFYGRPQDKLNNIAIGFAIGVIGGTLYTTYQAASQPRSYYSLYQSQALHEFEISQDRFSSVADQDLIVPIGYQFSF
ncbi:MAG: hypothetical protein GW917_00375 [Bdellovibrionales bacterium]|nr:hypothetical protein [Bdellovibrionales bacterium]